MRILLVLHGYPPEEAAGTELHARGAANELAALGHDVQVFAANQLGSSATHTVDQQGRVTVERFAGVVPAGEAAFCAALEQFCPDVVHVINVLFLSPKIIELAHAIAPTVVAPTDFSFVCPDVHIPVGRRHPLHGRFWGLNCFAHTELRSARWVASLIRRRRLVQRVRWHIDRAQVLRSALQSADLVLAPSEFIRRVYIEFGVEPNRIETLPLGLELTAPPERVERPAGLRIGFLGAFVRAKGADLLVQAFRGVDAEHARLVLRGHPLDPEYAAAVAAAAGGDDRIEVGTPVEAGKVLDFIGSLDLLVVPTRLHESFSRVAREAFLVGVPVLAARAGALPEIVTPGRNGHLFSAGDVDDLRRSLNELVRPEALERLHDFPHIKTMHEHARELVERYERLAV